MSYYPDLGLYAGTSSHTPLYIPGPYSKHSSILAANYSPLSTKTYPRNFRGYKPHLSTITERSQSPLGRLVHTKYIPSVQVPRPIKINTADIDVSVNRYRKYERARQKPAEIKTSVDREVKKSPSPSPSPSAIKKPEESPTESPSGSFKETEATPTKVIKRNRPTVRLHTIHRDKLPNEVINFKTWRDNFKPEELIPEERKQLIRKTPGEILKEKFLIREGSGSGDSFESDATPVKQKEEPKKSSSFHDICRSISSDSINENLNPGQPPAIRRKQSKQFSENLLREIRRSSADLSREEVAMLDNILQAENLTMEDKGSPKEDPDKSRMSVKRKKRITKKKSNEQLTTPNDTSDSDRPKSPLHRRPIQKYVRKSSTNSSLGGETIDEVNSETNQHGVRDISQVEIEHVKRKPKSIVTATVEVDEKTSPSLKAFVDDVEIQEVASPKKHNKFKFNVIVEDVEDVNESKTPIKSKKILGLKEVCEKGVVHTPKSKEPIICIKKSKSNVVVEGKIVEEIKEKPKKKVVKKSEIKEEKPTSSDAPKVIEKKPELNKEPEKVEVKLEESKVKIEEDIIKKQPEDDQKKSTIITTNTNKTTSNSLDDKPKTIKEPTPSTNDPLVQKSPGIPKAKSVDSANNNKDAPVKTSFDLKKTQSDQTVLNRKEAVKKQTEETCEKQKENKTIDTKTPDTKPLKEDKTEEMKPSTNKIELSKISSEPAIPDNKPCSVPKTSLKSGHGKSSVVKKVTIMSDIKEDQKEKKPDEINKPPEDVVKKPKKKTEPPPVTPNATQSEAAQEEEEEPLPKPAGKITSKRSLVNKPNKVQDPDLEVFIPPEPEPQASDGEQEENEDGSFKPLQSNRLSKFMHPFKKPEQYDDCPIEIYATPKTIRKRHYPRPRHAPPPPAESSDESSSEDESDESSSSDDTSTDGESNAVKVGASTSSNDSGFDSAARGSRKKGSDNRDSPTSSPANNPELALESNDPEDDYTKSSTFLGFQKSGRITPPATTIPRFKKYTQDDFLFLKQLGKGSFGKVLLAELRNTEYYYAVKCLKKDVVLEDDDVECTLIERKVLALGTKHPYLCHLLCTFQTESHLFFVMEYLNGGDLMFHIQQAGRFSEERGKFYAAEIVSGLKFLHLKGIVYRDLKLDNILLDYDGHVRIADFGMCKLQIFSDRMADTFCGTPDYMAPEIIKGLHYNQSVDWWSFGVLLYEMLLGQSPFSGCDEDELFWSICNEKPVLPRFLSQAARTILSLLLEKDASKRLGLRFSPQGEIQDQDFFREIDWQLLEARKLEPPFKPKLFHPLDTQYFDRTFTQEKAKLTPIDERILESMDQSQFQGFSYTNPNATDK